MSNLINQSLGRYHILEQIGEGGMATVYKAYDTRLETEVAVKVIRTEMFPPVILDRVLQRFEREAKALAKLNHPNIVSVIDYGKYGDAPYLVMKYMSGGTLKDSLKRPISYTEAIRVILPITRALAYAHEQGVLHRDVKPSNILITQSGEPVLTDFGIAKLLNSTEGQTLTGSGVGVGTPEYMAPEQGVGKEIDGRVDVYSLGVVFYEMITGRKPYIADTPMAVLLKQAKDPLPRPKEFVSDIPDEVEKVLFKALAKEPEDRYQSMKSFSNVLNNIVVQPLSIKEIQGLGNSDSMGKSTSPISSRKIEDEKTFDGFSAEVQNSVSKKETKPSGCWKWIGIGAIVFILFGFVAVFLIQNTQGGGIDKSLIVTDTQEIPAAKLAQTEMFKTTQTQSAINNKDVMEKIAGKTATVRALTDTPYDSSKNGTTQIREKDGMVQVFISAGEFTMGSNDEETNQQPEHNVYLDNYWIDKTEVTNSMYQLCVEEEVCIVPDQIKSARRDVYFGNPVYGEYPVIYVNWNQAKIYCEWIGGRLPTEAEWEKAARGTDKRNYPWGNNLPTNYLANFDNLIGDTVRVGHYQLGESPYGVLDMAGNVWEWVFDLYGEDYYQVSEVENPRGPSEGQMHILRGGSWVFNEQFLTTTYRKSHGSLSNDTIGFRCVNEIK